jgi:hypothetical protein
MAPLAVRPATCYNRGMHEPPRHGRPDPLGAILMLLGLLFVIWLITQALAH